MLLSRRLVREHEIARLLDKSVPSVRRLRTVGGGPPFVKIGGSIRYDLAALDKFIAQNNRTRRSKETAS
ncbi:MAG: helix-turn-helix transcriptional regulator [Methylocella sp.]